MSFYSVYFNNICLLANHFRPLLRMQAGQAIIVVQPATYDIPMLLPQLFPAYNCVIPSSADQAIHYIESLPKALPLPVQTLLIIDEFSSHLALKLQSILFHMHSTPSCSNLPVLREFPLNLSICIILSRSLIESRASGTYTSILRQNHLYAIKTCTVEHSLKSRVPLVIELGCLGKRLITSMIVSILGSNDPCQEPLRKNSTLCWSQRGIQEFISSANPLSLSSALFNVSFYNGLHINAADLPQLSSETDTLYQLMRSFFAASLLDARANSISSKILAEQYIECRFIRNLEYYIPPLNNKPNDFIFRVLSTKRLPTKRNLFAVYQESEDSGISATTILIWLYDYVYNVYNSVNQLGHFFECVSALYSTPFKFHNHTDFISKQIGWLLYELCVLRFTKTQHLPMDMTRISSFIPVCKTGLYQKGQLASYEQSMHLFADKKILNELNLESETNTDSELTS